MQVEKFSTADFGLIGVFLKFCISVAALHALSGHHSSVVLVKINGTHYLSVILFRQISDRSEPFLCNQHKRFYHMTSLIFNE